VRAECRGRHAAVRLQPRRRELRGAVRQLHHQRRLLPRRDMRLRARKRVGRLRTVQSSAGRRRARLRDDERRRRGCDPRLGPRHGRRRHRQRFRPARLLPLRPELRNKLRLLQWRSVHLRRQRVYDRPNRVRVHLSDSLTSVARHPLGRH
jgi:hypothetical protein